MQADPAGPGLRRPDDGGGVARLPERGGGFLGPPRFGTEEQAARRLGVGQHDDHRVVDAALATLWIAGIQAVIWGLVPISFMYGQTVLAWNKFGWFAIYATGMLLFVHTLLHPGMGLYGSSSEASLVSVTLLFVSFGAFSLLFWAYFRFRRPRPPAAPAPVRSREPVGLVSRFDRQPPL